jgi:hypothetical protein
MILRARGTLKSFAELHLEALHTGSRLTTWFREKHQPMAIDVKPERVIQVLSDAGITCVLMGTHGLNVYREEARATHDVDVLVRKKDVRKAMKVLHEAYPKLTINDTPVVARFVDPETGKAALDLMKPTQKVFQMVFRHTRAVGDTHRVPDLEMALVSKFAFTSPHRERSRKLQDVADFAAILEYNQNSLDRAKLQRLANSVYPDNGGKEIKQLVDDLLTGRPLQI